LRLHREEEVDHALKAGAGGREGGRKGGREGGREGGRKGGGKER
jgi:hypothetical protein